MTRLDALKGVYRRLDDAAVVTIMGAVSFELISLGHRPNFFYLQHAMGLASSIGLGIALARPTQQVIIFDGDGSLLMNLASLTTLARHHPPNLLHVVFDNESFASIGGLPTATASGTDLAAMAAAAGIPRTATARTLDAFTQAFDDALHARELTTLVAKVDAIPPTTIDVNMPLLENRFAFRKWLVDTTP